MATRPVTDRYPWERPATRVPRTSVKIYHEIINNSGWRIYRNNDLALRFIGRHAKSYSVLGDERFSDETRDVLRFTANEGAIEVRVAVFINGAVTHVRTEDGDRLILAIRESDAQRYGYPDEGYERGQKKDR